MISTLPLIKKLWPLGFWLVVWQLLALAVGHSLLLPGPWEVLVTLGEMIPQTDFWARIGYSGLRILSGFFLGLGGAALLAWVTHCLPWAGQLARPLLQFIKAAPVASFIILALLWVRSRNLAILISFLMVLPVLYGAILGGMEKVDRQLLEMARVFRIPLTGQLVHIWLPGLLPSFREGCRVALGLCWKSGIAAEVIGLPNGSMGDALYQAKITLNSPQVFGWTLVIIAISFAFEKGFLWVLDWSTRRLTREVES